MSHEKLAIGGLKIGPKLAQIVMQKGACPSVPEIFQRLSQARVNMTLVALEAAGGHLTGTCCISEEDISVVQTLLGQTRQSITIVTPVASLTLYPHHARLSLLEALLRAFSKAGIAIRAMASSLSALTVVTDYRQLDQALEAIGTIAELPANHAPVQPTIRIRQV